MSYKSKAEEWLKKTWPRGVDQTTESRVLAFASFLDEECDYCETPNCKFPCHTLKDKEEQCSGCVNCGYNCAKKFHPIYDSKPTPTKLPEKLDDVPTSNQILRERINEILIYLKERDNK